MDIGSYRPVPSRTASEEKLSLAASHTVYTYHCVCTHLLLATTTPLPALPTRQHAVDHAHMMPLAPPPSLTPAANKNKHVHTPMDHYGKLIATTVDRQGDMFQSDDGFEKRYLHRCGRCCLPIGYQLDWHLYKDADAGAAGRSGRREDIVYLFPGGLLTTREMVQGKAMDRVNVSVLEMATVAT